MVPLRLRRADTSGRSCDSSFCFHEKGVFLVGEWLNPHRVAGPRQGQGYGEGHGKGRGYIAKGPVGAIRTRRDFAELMVALISERTSTPF